MAKLTKKIFTKLRNKHRFVLINDNTFAEVASVRLNPLNVLSIFSALVIFFTLFLYLLFAYTPIGNLIPSRISKSDKREMLQLNQELEDLRRELEVKNSKAEVLNNLLSEKESLYDSTSVRMNR